MAVYTELSKNEIVEIISKFELGDLESYHPIIQGVQNTNYQIKTDAGNFVLTVSETEEDFEFGVEVLEFYEDNEIKVPKPMKTKQGNTVEIHNGKKFIITKLISGAQLKEIEPIDCYQIGIELAKMHKIGSEFPKKRENILNIDYLENKIENNIEKYESFNKKIRNILEMELDYIKMNIPFYKKLPKGLIHADLFPDNCLFNNGRISGILDFNDACIDYYNYDIATIINSWCFNTKHNLNKKHVTEFFSGYQSIRKLNNKEIFYLPSFCRLSAFSILVARLDRWAEDFETKEEDKNKFLKIHDPFEYLMKLKYHQEVLTADRYGL